MSATLDAPAKTEPLATENFPWLPLPKAAEGVYALYAVHLEGDGPEGYWPAFLVEDFETQVLANVESPFAISVDEMRRIPKSRDELSTLEHPPMAVRTYPDGRPIRVKTRAFQCADRSRKGWIFCEVPEVARLYRHPPIDGIQLWCPGKRGANDGGAGEHGVFSGLQTTKTRKGEAQVSGGVCPLCTAGNPVEVPMRLALMRRQLVLRYEACGRPLPTALATQAVNDNAGALSRTVR